MSFNAQDLPELPGLLWLSTWFAVFLANKTPGLFKVLAIGPTVITFLGSKKQRKLRSLPAWKRCSISYSELAYTVDHYEAK